MDSSIIIAIDGYASTGKSTLAKMLSKYFQIPFIDSGALYRGITLYGIEKQTNDLLDEFKFEFET